MRRKAAIIFWIISISLVLFLAGSTSLFGAMAGNVSDTAFDEEDPPPATTESLISDSPSELKRHIVDGGGAFLQSSSDFQSLISQYEFSEIYKVDFEVFQNSLNAAIENMKRAQSAYRQLKDLASNTPYNYGVLCKLYAFDYWSFCETRNLVPSIFRNVQWYLMFGDVRGVYNRFYSQTGILLADLQAVKTDLDAKIMPQLSDLWRINQKYAEFNLFGQYVAEVFYNL